MEKNEMCNSGNSPELLKKLEASETPELKSKIEFLRQCGVDEKYLEMFAVASLETTNNLVQALGDQPSAEAVGVANAYLSTEFNTPRREFNKLSFIEYSSTRIRGQVMAAANDDDFSLAA